MRPREIWVTAGLALTLGSWGCSERPHIVSAGDGGIDAGAGPGGATDAGATAGSGGSFFQPGDAAPGSGGASGSDVACGATRVEASSVPVNILLVLDKSGSMNDPLAAGTRWSAMKTAVGAALDHVKGTISFGLEFFPNAMDAAQTCDVPAGEAAVVIPIGPGTTTVPEIVKAFDATRPAGGTPTATALARAHDYFTAGGGKNLPGDRFVLLATDGGPTCNSSLTCATETCTLNLDDPQRTCGPRTASGGAANCCDARLPNGPSGCLDDAATTAQIRKLALAGVKTFVVGIPGTEVYARSLDQFAVAGGATNPSGPPSYFAVSASGGAAGLTEVFSAITTRLITTCRLQLQSAPPDVTKLNVSVDGRLGPQGPDGWLLDTSTTPPTIVLNGTTCARVQVNGANAVQVVYGCPTIK